MLTKQTSEDIKLVLNEDELHLKNKFKIFEKETVNPGDYNMIWYKKWDLVLVLYKDDNWKKYITQEQYSEKHCEYFLVNYEYNWKDWCIFLAWIDDEFDYESLVTDWKWIEIIS